MDYETKIYFDKLVEAVEKLDSSDWWGFGATIFVGLVAAWITNKLGKRQNELQQQQLKIQERQNELQEQQLKLQEQQNELQKQQIHQQEYELYRRMFIQIENVDIFVKILLHRIALCFYNMVDKQGRLSMVEETLEEHKSANKDLIDCTFDIQLKQCGNTEDVGAYFKVLSESKDITLMVKYLIEADKITFANCFDNYQIDEKTDSQTLINIIVGFCKDNEYRETLYDKLLKYDELVQNATNSHLKLTIKERIISNDVA